MTENIEERWSHRRMVSWYNPFQLGRTAVQVATSQILGARADYRVIEALAAHQEAFNYGDRNEIWIDYAADLGDGWNSTYTIASLLGRESLGVPSREKSGRSHRTKRGDILIMGGDEVYPAAAREEYRARLVGPYECALERTQKPHPLLFAIPGNHDWYDGLVSFDRLICQGRWFGGWCTQQKLSYFALKLPGRWWLLGVDVQLESDIDTPQLDYFRRVASEEMKQGDCVILCTAEPDWIYGNIYDRKLQNNLAYLEKKIIERAGARVMVSLAGDLHHYRRHESTGRIKVQKVTSGGGGAFLHPTNGQPVDRITVGPGGKETEFVLKEQFPTRRTSARLAWRNLLFPVLNPGFGILTGFAYVAVAWVLQRTLSGPFQETPLAWANAWLLFEKTFGAVLQAPAAFAWVFGLVLGFVFFTDTHSKLYKWIAGSVHASAHLFANFLLAWLVTRLTVHTLSLEPGSFLQLLAAGTGLFVGGYLAGSWLMGLYLLVSLNAFGRHSNEAFSSLQIEGYKNFLRLHIGANGKLTIYPIGIKKVPTQWVPAKNPGVSEPKFVPKGKQEIQAFLIEEPVEVVCPELALSPKKEPLETHCGEDSHAK